MRQDDDFDMFPLLLLLLLLLVVVVVVAVVCSFKYRPIPAIVPPVPADMTKADITG
jgi:hypothetical protein